VWGHIEEALNEEETFLSLFDSSFVVLYIIFFYLLGLILLLILFNKWYEIDAKVPGKKVKYRLPEISKRKFINLHNELFKTVIYLTISILLAPKVILSLVNQPGMADDILLNILILSISVVEFFSNLISFIFSLKLIRNEKETRILGVENKEDKDILKLEES